MTTEQKHEISIPGLPEGYRLVRVEITNDRYRNDDGTSTIRGCSIVIEKIKKPRITFEFVVKVTKDNTAYFSSEHGYVCFDNKWWRQVEEE